MWRFPLFKTPSTALPQRHILALTKKCHGIMESSFDKFADTAFVSAYGGMFPLSSAFRHSFRLAHLSPVVHSPEQRCPILNRRRNVLATDASAFESRRAWSDKRFTGFQNRRFENLGNPLMRETAGALCIVDHHTHMAQYLRAQDLTCYGNLPLSD